MGGPADDAGRLGARVYRRTPDISYTRFGDEGLIVVPRRSMNVVVNDLGLRVLELLDGSADVNELARRVGEEYDGPSQQEIVADVVEILDDLADKGAVEVVAPGA